MLERNLDINITRILALKFIEEEIESTVSAFKILLEWWIGAAQRNSSKYEEFMIATKGKHTLYPSDYPNPEKLPMNALLRIILPSIEFMGHAITSKGKQKDRALSYISKYLGRLNPEYVCKSSLIWDVYRNMAIHHGSIISKAINENLELNISYGIGSPERHLQILNNKFHLDLPTLFEDYQVSASLFLDDIKASDTMIKTFEKFLFKCLNSRH